MHLSNWPFTAPPPESPDQLPLRVQLVRMQSYAPPPPSEAVLLTTRQLFSHPPKAPPPTGARFLERRQSIRAPDVVPPPFPSDAFPVMMQLETTAESDSLH